MFWIIAMLLFVGIFLILLEAAVPHGLSAIAGALVVGASVFLSFRFYGVGMGAIYLVVAGGLSTAAAFVVYRSGVRYMALLPEDGRACEEKESGCPRVGEVLRVTQPLRPTGSVEWEGRRYPARSLRPESEIPVGARVSVKDYDSVYLLVDLAD